MKVTYEKWLKSPFGTEGLPPENPRTYISNFPFLSSNIPQSPAYGVFVSQLIRYARASSLYEDFIMRSQLLTSKLLKQGFTRNRLIATFRNSMAVTVYWLTGLKFRLRILSLTCFLRRFTIDDLVLCHFTARAFTDIDV